MFQKKKAIIDQVKLNYSLNAFKFWISRNSFKKWPLISLTLILPTFQNYEIYRAGANIAPAYYFQK